MIGIEQGDAGVFVIGSSHADGGGKGIRAVEKKESKSSSSESHIVERTCEDCMLGIPVW